ncbi:MAG: YjbH domain-containing protein, partial [Candidatus Cloacimonetes bacterium]|nr:YjbH domain-containing protein [Candidatus Cloacimonadota bacterium]
MRYFFVIIFVITAFCSVSAFETMQLVQAPTAGILERGEASTLFKIYRNNGLLAGARVGLFQRFLFGVSYGGEQIVGNLDPVWNKRVEFNAKFRIMDEDARFPAVAIGINTQGHGAYDSSNNRYEIKSKGFYCVASQNFSFLGNLGLHGGINYSLETGDGDKDPNLFLGVDKSIGPVVSAALEYDTALNDNKEDNDDLRGDGKGFLNVGIQVKMTDNLSVHLTALDLLENGPATTV